MEVHLEEPVLRLHVALRVEQVVGGGGVDLRDAVVVADHLHLRAQPGDLHLAVGLRNDRRTVTTAVTSPATRARTSTAATYVDQRAARGQERKRRRVAGAGAWLCRQGVSGTAVIVPHSAEVTSGKFAKRPGVAIIGSRTLGVPGSEHHTEPPEDERADLPVRLH